jgi:T-complex protein 11
MGWEGHDGTKEPPDSRPNEQTREKGENAPSQMASNNATPGARRPQHTTPRPPVRNESGPSRPVTEGPAPDLKRYPRHHSTTPNTPPTITISARSHTNDQESTSTITLPPCNKHDTETLILLQAAAFTPPVTPDTLKELDLPFIQNNINLRVDAPYDSDLHFMPISGRRGDEKRLEAHKYWKCLEIEFNIYQHNACPCAEPECAGTSKSWTPFIFKERLPVMFHKLKALLLILVPSHDHERVINTLDVALLMQEVRNGVLNVVGLAEWLSALLTTHCAPIRDEWAHDMTTKISAGVQQNDMSSLVAGLEKLFSFCEAMKLDVANHQIRTFRVPLIEDGVSFQIDYFQTRIRLGKLDPSSSQRWFAECYEHCLSKGSLQSEYSPLIYGLVELATGVEAEIPEVLRYDTNRITQLREEISDLIHLDICCGYLAWGIGQQLSPPGDKMFKTRLLDLTDGESDKATGSNAIWDAHLDAISTEVTRVTASAHQSSGEFVSAAVFAHDREELEHRFHAEPEARIKELALNLQQQVLTHAQSFNKLSALHISEQQQYHQQWRQRSAQGRQLPDLDDMARRLAHIAVIHWRVWRGLIYWPETERICEVRMPDSGHASS